MQIQNLLTVLSLCAVAFAENKVEPDDVPQACRTTDSCRQVIDVSRSCDQTTDNDNTYRSCVCGTTNIQTLLNDCATYVTDLMRDCGWAYNTTATTTSLSGTVRPTVLPSPTTITSGGTTITTTPTPTLGTVASTTSTPAGAPAVTAGLGMLAGVALAIPALI
ncbi:uncharacterized protein JN550_008013 [Neoarthrinium moseri]|uniref:uncharacterized protein n=1 Tax=Neoarthrinium moseri TaxID=1658444 RepID=UPI001FDC8884|nr:uncharacterized protein JN550_008013 [Neoarthrinium moseri]KAI1866035.1 hypothetical protein JN550_008013 [Neoarthrinium moseri]